MAGRNPKVDHVKASFLSELKSAKDLASKVNQLKGSFNPNAKQTLHPKDVRQVIELAFMGAVASWEEFLERTLVRYVAGATTKTGYAPTPKVGRAISLKHAYQVLSGNPKFDNEKDYLKVSDPKWVTNSADFLFSAHSFGELRAKNNLLGHATTIRNRVAHSSEKCRADFKTTVVHFLKPVGGKLSKGYGPGDLLMAEVERHFGQSTLQAKKKHFEAYLDLLESLADKIVP